MIDLCNNLIKTFKQMKKILLLSSIACLSLLVSCGTTEIVNPTLASEIGSGKVSGKFRVDLNETNLSNGSTIYEDFPAGAAVLQVTYSQSDVNPTSSSGENLTKVFNVSIAADGTYSFEVPASAKGTAITVRPLDFVATRIVTGETKKYIYSSSSFSLTVVKGGSYPQPIRTYFVDSAAE